MARQEPARPECVAPSSPCAALFAKSNADEEGESAVNLSGQQEERAATIDAPKDGKPQLEEQ